MSTDTILLYAVGVFLLMIVGIFLTMLEFNRISDEPSQRKGDGAPPRAHQPQRQAGQQPNVRVVYSKNDAA